MAEKILIKCDECGKQFHISESMAGRMARCPCGAIMTVPEAPGSPESEQQPAAEQAQETAEKLAPSGEDISRKWYYAKGGERFGPVPQAELMRLLERGEIEESAFVWTKSMAAWRPAGELRELGFEVLEAEEEPAEPEAGEAQPEPEAAVPETSEEDTRETELVATEPEAVPAAAAARTPVERPAGAVGAWPPALARLLDALSCALALVALGIRAPEAIEGVRAGDYSRTVLHAAIGLLSALSVFLVLQWCAAVLRMLLRLASQPVDASARRGP